MKKTKMTRVLSAFLALVLVLGSLHLPALNVSSATVDLTKDQVGNDTYVADPGTMNGWQTYFGENSTEFAGAVWSDKSVFTADTKAFDNIVRRGGVVDAQGMLIIALD